MSSSQPMSCSIGRRLPGEKVRLWRTTSARRGTRCTTAFTVVSTTRHLPASVLRLASAESAAIRRATTAEFGETRS